MKQPERSLIDEVRARLQKRSFLKRHLSLEIAPYAFHLLELEREGGQLKMRYSQPKAGIQEEDEKQLAHLASLRFPFAESIAASQLLSWWETSEGKDAELFGRVRNADEFADFLFAHPEKKIVPGKRYEVKLAEKKRSWTVELMALVRLHLRLEEKRRAAAAAAETEARVEAEAAAKKKAEAEAQLEAQAEAASRDDTHLAAEQEEPDVNAEAKKGSAATRKRAAVPPVGAPHSSPGSQIEWFIAPIFTFGLPYAFIVITTAVMKEIEARYLIDLVCTELEDFREQRIIDDVMERIVHDSAEVAIRKAVEGELNRHAPDFRAVRFIEWAMRECSVMEPPNLQAKLEGWTEDAVEARVEELRTSLKSGETLGSALQKLFPDVTLRFAEPKPGEPARHQEALAKEDIPPGAYWTTHCVSVGTEKELACVEFACCRKAGVSGSGPSADGKGPLESHREKLTQIVDSILERIKSVTKNLEITNARITKALQRRALSAVATQSLSHNIGSHALSDAELFDAAGLPDGYALKDFHHYLQARLDYVAQTLSPVVAQPEPLFFFRDVLREFFRQRLLLNRLVADRGFPGTKLSFAISFPACAVEHEFTWDEIVRAANNELGALNKVELAKGDVLVGMPGGAVGAHALFSIFENILRNSAKYGKSPDGSLRFCLHLKKPTIRTSASGNPWYVLEISDNSSGFTKEEEKQECGPWRSLARNFEQSVIDDEGNERQGGHGLVEIKEAMQFLHKDSVDDMKASAPHGSCAPGELPSVENVGVKDQERGRLVFRVRLHNPNLLGVVAPGFQASPPDGVRFAPDLEAVIGLNHHILIILDEELDMAGTLNKLRDAHRLLPFRLLILCPAARGKEWKEVLGQFKGNFLPPNRFRIAADDDTFNHLLEQTKVRQTPASDSDGLALVNRMYECWLRAYKPPAAGCKWNLVVCFQRGGEIVERWAAAQTYSSDLIDLSVYKCRDTEGDEGRRACEQRPQFAVGRDLPDVLSPENGKHLIIFANHGVEPAAVADYLRSSRAAFLSDFGSKEGPRTFRDLYSPPRDKEAFAFFILQLVEAALTKVAVFDERTLPLLLKDVQSHGFAPRRVRDGLKANLIVLYSIKGTEPERPACARTDLPLQPAKAEGYLAVASAHRLADLSTRPDLVPDALVLHEGLLEELKEKKLISENLDGVLFPDFTWLVRMSGKGPLKRRLNVNLPFCEYSAFNATILRYRDDVGARLGVEKLAMAQAILNCIGAMGPGPKEPAAEKPGAEESES